MRAISMYIPNRNINIHVLNNTFLSKDYALDNYAHIQYNFTVGADIRSHFRSVTPIVGYTFIVFNYDTAEIVYKETFE